MSKCQHSHVTVVHRYVAEVTAHVVDSKWCHTTANQVEAPNVWIKVQCQDCGKGVSGYQEQGLRGLTHLPLWVMIAADAAGMPFKLAEHPLDKPRNA